MLDLIAAVGAELAGKSAANYAALSDAAAAAALATSGTIYQDVPISVVAGYCETNFWDGKAPPYIMEQLIGMAAGAPSAAQMVAAKALRVFGIGCTPQFTAFDLTNPPTLQTLQGLLQQLVTDGMAQSNADAILAFGAPVIAPHAVTVARILNGAKYDPWSWSQGAATIDPTNISNAWVQVTIKNATTGESKIVDVKSQYLTQALIDYQAAANLANLVARDAAIAALGG